MYRKIFPWLFVGILIGYVLGGILPNIAFEQEKKEYEELIDNLVMKSQPEELQAIEESGDKDATEK